MEIKVQRMALTHKGLAKAFCTVVLEEGEEQVYLTNWKVVNGGKGLFAAPPSEKGRDGKYHELYFFNRPLKDRIQRTVLEEYRRQSAEKRREPAKA